MLTIIPVILTAGVVSALDTFTELVPLESLPESARFNAPPRPGGAIQLDAWIHSPDAHGSRVGAVVPGPAHTMALPA